MEENRNEMEINEMEERNDIVELENDSHEIMDIESINEDDNSKGISKKLVVIGVLGAVVAGKTVYKKIKARKDDNKPKRKFHIGWVDVPDEESSDEDVVIDVDETEVDVEPEEK